jgi:glycerol dehydrogenase
MFKRLYAFNESVSLPVSLSDIEISQDNLEDVISKAVLMKDSEHNPYKITKDMLREAFEKLSKYNKEKQ